MRNILAVIIGIGGLSMATIAPAQEATLSLSSDRPGNLYPVDGAVKVTVTAEPAAECDWSLRDYDEKQVAVGRVAAGPEGTAVDLGGLAHGYYELTCIAGELSRALAFGVVTDHSATAPPSTRLNVDGATAWLSPREQFDDLAKMLRTVGMGWVRERFSWGGTEPTAGEVNWQQYDAVAEAYSAQGVRVYQIWHDSPGWTRPGKEGSRNPDDLRDVYRFARRVAERYKGSVEAWEVWNEPDIGFWPDLGDTFAGLQKAAYLGFKAGDPDLPVLQGSFCRGYCAFDEHLFEAGLADYFDIFNWHIYASPGAYAGVLGPYLELLERYDCADRPVWLTEAGIRLVADEPEGELSADLERLQAEFVPKSFAASLAAGVDRHFFFVYPWYLENGVQFGSLRKDLSPRPGFIAIAAALDLLGEARYLGRYDTGDEGATIEAFDSGDGVVLVAWASEGTVVELDLGIDSFVLADEIGRRRQMEARDGKYTLELGAAPVYIAGLPAEVNSRLTGAARPEGKLPTNVPSPVVVRGQARVAELDKGADCYLVGSAAFDYNVEVYNFSEAKPARGSVRLEVPAGWSCEPAAFEATLEPMGRMVQTVRITPGPAHGEAVRVRSIPTFEDTETMPCVSGFRFDVSRIEPTRALDLGLEDPAKWQTNVSGNGTMETVAGAEGGVRFNVRFTAQGDRWCYPRVDFDPPADFSAYDGISFEYRCGPDPAKVTPRIQVTESPGSNYLTDAFAGSGEWRKQAYLFRNMSWGSFSPPDPNGKLDTDAILHLLVGLNTSVDDVWLEVRNVQMVRYFE